MTLIAHCQILPVSPILVEKQHNDSIYNRAHNFQAVKLQMDSGWLQDTIEMVANKYARLEWNNQVLIESEGYMRWWWETYRSEGSERQSIKKWTECLGYVWRLDINLLSAWSLSMYI